MPSLAVANERVEERLAALGSPTVREIVRSFDIDEAAARARQDADLVGFEP
jgi:hypothetical protein